MSSRQRWIAGILGAVVIVTISVGVLWSARVNLLTWLLIRQLTATTNREASIERVALDLQKGRVEIAGLRLADRRPGSPFAEVDRVDVQFDPGALFRARLQIEEIALRGVRVRIVRSESGELNFPDLVLSGRGVLDVTIDRLALADGHVVVEDRSRTPVHSWPVSDVVLDVSGLSIPGRAGSGRLAASLAGAPVSAEVAELRLAPLHLRGRLAVDNVDATVAGVFLPAGVVAVVDGARLTASANVTADAREGMRLQADGRLDTLTVRNRRSGDAFASVPSLAFAVDGARVDSSGGIPSLGRVTVTADATLFDARGSAGGRLGIERLRLTIEEAAPSAPGSAPVVLAAAFGGGGGLDVRGLLRMSPLSAELRGRITDLDATVLLSYANLPVRLAAAVDTDLTVDVTSSSGRLTSRIRGRAAVKRAAVTDGTREIARARQIEIDGVDAEWPRLAIARVRVAEPVALVARDQDGRLTAATLFASPRQAPATSAPAGLSFEIGEITVADGTMTLDDAMATPPVRLMLTKLRASARNAAWPARRPLSIDLQAATPEAGTVEASGTVSLDPAKVDVRARVAGAPLAPYQGYMPFPMRVQGFVQLDLAIAAAFGEQMAVTAKGTGALNDLTMRDGDRGIMRVSRIETTGLDYTWPTTLGVDTVRVSRSRVRIERRADGTFPLPALLERPKAPKATTDPAAGVSRARPAPPMAVTVRSVVLEDGGARWIDAAVSPGANIEISEMRLTARDFSWPPRGPIPIEVRATTPGGGRVSMNGSLDLAAKSLETKVAVAAVDLAPARPYLPPRAQLDAKASADLDVKARREPPSITARGTASLADMAFTHDGRPGIGVARLEVSGVDYAWPATVAIDRLRLQTPRAHIERARDGTFPLVTFFTGLRAVPGPRPESSAPAGAGPLPLQVSIRESVVDDGSATWSDDTVRPAARVEVAQINVVARDMAWPARGPVPVKARASLPGQGTVTAQGQVGLAPTSVDLDVVAEGIDLANARSYVSLRGEARGKAGAKLKVNVTAKPLAITARGTAAIADVSVVKGDQSLASAERIELTGVDYAWPATVTVDRLSVQKPWALIDRISGQVPVMEALSAPPSPDARRQERAARSQPRPASSPLPLQLTLRRGLFENGAATIVDSSVDPPVRLEITSARLFVRDLVWPAREASRFTARAVTPNGGSLEARGQVRLDPPAIETTVVLKGTDLASIEPLFPLRGRLAGKATADLQVKGPLNPMALTITGTLGVADASFGDAERPLITSKAAELTGISAEWPQRRATVQRIRIREPWALVERDADGKLPLLALLELKAMPGAAAAPASDGAVTPVSSAPTKANSDGNTVAAVIAVGTLVVEEGFVRFTDRTITPRFVEEASRLTLTATKLGTAPATRSEITMTARLSGGAHVELQGTTGAIGGPLYADLRGKLSELPLNRANPYLNNLLGWVAREGSIGGTTHFQIQDDHLVSENEFVIGQPLFVPSRRGDEVRERVGVPLDLLVSLLQNTRHEVRMSVPVTGTISSRQFDFGDAVWEAIRKAAINVLALPISWVGKMFYTKESHIATISIWPVSFEPGTTTMRRDIDKHAERLATFMKQTPSIAFVLKPVMTVEDVDALKRDALRKRIDALAKDAGSVDAAAAKLFAERFPARTAPADPAAVMAELAKAEALPDNALQSLADARIALVRRELQSKGDVDPARLRVSEGAVPVEASGQGRVEFEMMPDVAAAQ